MKGGKKRERNTVKTEEYEVDDIVSHKKERGLDLFRVRWKGFDESDDTWEVESNLAHAPMFHAKMQDLKKQTEQRLADKEAEAAAQAHAKKRRRPAASESADPSRPCDVEASAEEEDLDLRVYATGTKVPKNHLPDENALGSRLTILRFKRAVPAAHCLEEDVQEEGHDISVTYTIDGTDTYTIPFTAARRYCCQRLLSYLIRRTTFRSPRGSQESPGGGEANTACAGSSPQQSAFDACCGRREAELDGSGGERRPSGAGQTVKDERRRAGGLPAAAAKTAADSAAAPQDADQSPAYLRGLKVLKEKSNSLGAGAQSSSVAQSSSGPRLVDAV
ncbi:hypothetical protein Efla_003664 [Eimeria flavescens]